MVLDDRDLSEVAAGSQLGYFRMSQKTFGRKYMGN